MENSINIKIEGDRKVWFSMWFLGAVVTFGLAFFPMFYRLVEGRNTHLHREAESKVQIAAFLERNGKKSVAANEQFTRMNAKAWAISIILVVPIFVILYLLSKDLTIHEQQEDAFFTAILPERIFMPQTIPIKTYALITIVTLGVGAIYWLYKVVNLYNAHFKAHLIVDKELVRLMEEKRFVEHM